MDNTLQLKCPNCGASIGFNAASQLFICEFCNSDFTEAEINLSNGREAEISNADGISLSKDDYVSGEKIAPENNFAEHTNLYLCESCGAEIVADENTAATFCHYCHGTVTLKGRVSGALQPELIIPFKIDKAMAETTFKTWCGKKWFLPKSFSSQGQLEKMVGLYVPFWLADCEVDASAEYDAKKINSYRSGDYRITNTKIYSASRAAKMEYRGIPADGSRKLEDELMDAVEPFDYNEFLPFSMNYFSGFYADKYDVEKSEAINRIKQRMTEGAMQVLRQSVTGYTTVSCKGSRLRIMKTHWHYAMLPVWFMTYMYSGKKYFFAINGQTGKVAGIIPVSAGKLIFMALCFILGFTLFGLIGGGLV
ncbi:MAG: hypothetical protein IJ035_05615 [Oscillospiraceae bacterium]|nr:hypothetical protein [Oscillospiraceae bacterium]